jgi:hypothetical protein
MTRTGRCSGMAKVTDGSQAACAGRVDRQICVEMSAQPGEKLGV